MPPTRFDTPKWAGMIFLCLLLVGCRGIMPNSATSAGPDSDLSSQIVTNETDAAEPAVPGMLDTAGTGATGVRELTIFYTNDEHGWMEGVEDERGAANLAALWRERGYNPDTHLVLSGGDMWTGPAISTWFEGEGMAEVLNSMGYSAAAVGNHEFDFGLDVLQERATQSNFPFLSANIRYKDSGETPVDLGILPFSLIEVNDISVGLVGLTTNSTPRTTNPTNVSGFDFIDYETALRETVPLAREAGAQMVLVPAHLCREETDSLARRVEDLDIDMIGGGHCHELYATETAGTVLLSGGAQLESFAEAHFWFDLDSQEVVDSSFGIAQNLPAAMPDPQVAEIVQAWREQVEEELSEVIGHLDRKLARRSPEMQALVVESWLAAYPADVAMTNLGGFRADLPAGDITLARIVTVLPFNNTLIEVELTGKQLLRVLALGDAAVGGARFTSGQWQLHDGSVIEPTAYYSLLVNDFMYAGGDNYSLLAELDPDGYETTIDWRQPLIDWIQAQDSSADHPIDNAIMGLVK